MAPSDRPAPYFDDAEGVWVLRVETGGRVQEYRCATQGQAQHMATLFVAPAELPPPPSAPGPSA